MQARQLHQSQQSQQISQQTKLTSNKQIRQHTNRQMNRDKWTYSKHTVRQQDTSNYSKYQSHKTEQQ